MFFGKFSYRMTYLKPIKICFFCSTRDPVYREEEEAFESWWSKTPLGRRRQRFLELEEERLVEEQAQQAKQGNGNKKKV